MSLVAIKSAIDALSAPTVSFTLLTVLFPFFFPPSEWFEKIQRNHKRIKLAKKFLKKSIVV